MCTAHSLHGAEMFAVPGVSGLTDLLHRAELQAIRDSTTVAGPVLHAGGASAAKAPDLAAAYPRRSFCAQRSSTAS